MPRKFGGWAAFVLGVWICLACSREPKSEEAPAPSASAVARFAAAAPKPGASAAPARRRWGGHARGPAGTLLINLRVLELSAQQESTVSAIETDLRASSDPWRLRGELAQALATEVRAGKIDRAKLEPQLKAARAAATEDNARQAKALNTLHGALDETQRKVLVGAVRARQKQGAEHTAFGAKPEAPEQGRNARRAKRELERLTLDLELEPQQREKAEKILAANPNFAGPSRDALQPSVALLDAFEKPAFDATKLELDRESEAAFNQRLDYLKKLTALLTPKQRDKLASSLIDRAGFDHSRSPP